MKTTSPPRRRRHSSRTNSVRTLLFGIDMSRIRRWTNETRPTPSTGASAWICAGYAFMKASVVLYSPMRHTNVLTPAPRYASSSPFMSRTCEPGLVPISRRPGISQLEVTVGDAGRSCHAGSSSGGYQDSLSSFVDESSARRVAHLSAGGSCRSSTRTPIAVSSSLLFVLPLESFKRMLDAMFLPSIKRPAKIASVLTSPASWVTFKEGSCTGPPVNCRQRSRASLRVLASRTFLF
mmetsp:Transcript_8246/g.34630  ORF Transcript_8246/g.34630 Transcript_8246/m.34630 type:complete len:236 (-) Transcript_8246:406-1113(-)